MKANKARGRCRGGRSDTRPPLASQTPSARPNSQTIVDCRSLHRVGPWQLNTTVSEAAVPEAASRPCLGPCPLSVAESEEFEGVEGGGQRHVLGAAAHEAGGQLHDGRQSARLVPLERAVTVHEVHRSDTRPRQMRSVTIYY